MVWILELGLTILLAATLFHAVRLERALRVLKRDRASLEELVAGFNTSTRQAEQGIEQLRNATDGAGQQIARQIDGARTLTDDLTFLTERGERIADRLETLIRAARPLAAVEAPRQAVPDPVRAVVAESDPADPRVRSQAERDLLKALRMAR
jgi:ABC-type transporter Mla subunit MlaD